MEGDPSKKAEEEARWKLAARWRVQVYAATGLPPLAVAMY